MNTYSNIASTRKHDIIKRTHISLTSLKPKRSIHHRTKAPQKGLRPWQTSIRRDKSDSSKHSKTHRFLLVFTSHPPLWGPYQLLFVVIARETLLLDL